MTVDRMAREVGEERECALLQRGEALLAVVVAMLELLL
jgi:hypothetical protein